MLPAELTEALKQLLSENELSFSPTSGGCINNGGQLKTSHDTFFIKWNDRKKFPGMFQAEKRGLELIGKQNLIRTPQALHLLNTNNYQAILLEWIAPGKRSARCWENLGHQLAMLHQVSARQFGLDHDNYIGSLPQLNKPSDNWITFFIEQRLKVQLNMAIDSGAMPTSNHKLFERLYDRLPELLPDEQPALIHGDLWSGNLLVTSIGDPCLIDPAVYFGHREAELAFTRLFGGFDAAFYSSYQEVFPTASGFEGRVDLYNLYPILVHANLFGGGYGNQATSIVRRFA